MARTASHVPYTRRDENHNNHDESICSRRPRYGGYAFDWSCSYTGPAHSIDDLRYSAAALATAEATGTRPVPTRVVATLDRQGWARQQASPGEMRYYANQRERASRSALRTDLIAARGWANAALTDPWVEDGWDDLLDEIDVLPIRTRHSARWDVW